MYSTFVLQFRVPTPTTSPCVVRSATTHWRPVGAVVRRAVCDVRYALSCPGQRSVCGGSGSSRAAVQPVCRAISSLRSLCRMALRTAAVRGWWADLGINPAVSVTIPGTGREHCPAPPAGPACDVHCSLSVQFPLSCTIPGLYGTVEHRSRLAD